MAWPEDQNPPLENATLNSIAKDVKKLLSAVVAPEALGATAPQTPSGRRAETVEDALLNAYLGLDADGYPHRWSGTHAGSTEDFVQHCKDNNLQYPNIDFGPSQFGHPAYKDWNDPFLALYLLSQSDGLKTPEEIKLLGFAGTIYDEKIKNNGWKKTTVGEWFDKIRSTNGQGGASGGPA